MDTDRIGKVAATVVVVWIVCMVMLVCTVSIVRWLF